MSFERYEVMAIEEALNVCASALSQSGPALGLGRLLKLLDTPATTAVIENDYIDVDYSATTTSE